jgi:hypothetical protein
VLVALVALAAFGLVLVLARRLREVTERVNKFLPMSGGGLPDPGSPLPEFTAVAVDSTPVTHADLAGPNRRVFALLTTDCTSCHDQLPALRDLDAGERPIVLVIGPPEDRAGMVASLAEHAVVIEEKDDGPIAESLEINEFPAVLVVSDGVVRMGGHGLSEVRASLEQPAQA